ncbi:hypothetical protein AHAS_Ahas05G0131200 [Arachis hypogaea]|uniref:Uncharacterized protein n=1 Tax=Arachis hypogaea TaxID=3818 RepID=A0A445D6K5_ARAHY|nr:hypothetical protein Ahy_A05g024636 isoform B [Arachis hypogaea]
MKASLRSVKSTGGCILGLGETNLCMYNDVGKICEQVLSLSNNLMSPYKSELPPLESICILVLNNTGADWEQPMSSSIVQGFNSLRLLNLDDNCIAECDEVMKLSQLKMVGYGFKYVLNSRLD